MNDLISRQAVLDITWEEPSYTDALNVLTEVRDKVKELPIRQSASIDRRCDMNTNTWKSAFNTGYDMGRADGIAEMEKEAQDLRHEVDDLKQKLVDLALDYGRMLRKMGG